MEYYLSTNEPFQTGINRILDACRNDAATAFAKNTDLHEAVHKVRRSLKMERAVLRLIRDELGEELFHEENRFYRDVSREVSHLRDLTALLKTLDTIETPYQKTTGKAVPATLRKYIERERTLTLRENKKDFRRLSEALTSRQLATASIDWSAHFLKNMLSSMERVYSRGYFCLQENLVNPSPHSVHQWRKRSKYLRYQVQMLRMAWLPMLNPFEKQLHRLTDFLGAFNDRTVLVNFLESTDTGLDAKDMKNLKEVCAKEQGMLLGKALELGKKTYAEKPAAFKKRIKVYVENWQPFQ